jgi:hypothetical protein
MSSFKYFPKIKYNNLTSINLLSKVALISSYKRSYEKYYDYLIKEGERPDIIAYREYGDASLDWIIYLSNEILDPYKDWPMDYRNFINYLEDRYNVSADKLTSVVIPSSIAYYYYKGLPSDSQNKIDSYNYTMTQETYMMLNQPAGWIAKSIYDVENEKNEQKRNIKILRQPYVNEFKQQFKDLING